MSLLSRRRGKKRGGGRTNSRRSSVHEEKKGGALQGSKLIEVNRKKSPLLIRNEKRGGKKKACLRCSFRGKPGPPKKKRGGEGGGKGFVPGTVGPRPKGRERKGGKGQGCRVGMNAQPWGIREGGQRPPGWRSWATTAGKGKEGDPPLAIVASCQRREKDPAGREGGGKKKKGQPFIRAFPPKEY